MRCVVGCDPGFAGAIAVLTTGAPKLHRMPVIRKPRNAYDIDGISNLLYEYGPSEMIPANGPRPLLVVESVTRPASLTYCMGLLVGMGWTLDYEVARVRPQEWKRYFGLGPVKADSIALALKTWPSLKRTITRAGDDGLAEAALIALWARENLE